jgi:hypothetical protein
MCSANSISEIMVSQKSSVGFVREFFTLAMVCNLISIFVSSFEIKPVLHLDL